MEKDLDPIQINRIKYGVLLLLTIQNSGHALFARYTTTILGESYSGTELVFVSELIKLAFSTYITLNEKANSDAPKNGVEKLVWLLARSTKIIVLVILYSIANMLSYFALSRVDAAVYTVLLQLKILTTAFFSVILLSRSFSGVKWRALILLILGCILVASPAFNHGPGDSSTDGDEKVSFLDFGLGVTAILGMVLISGYTAVYLETMLKHENITVWERNFQLAFFSSIFLTCYRIVEQMANNQSFFDGLFAGWTINAFILCLIQAGGGLLVAATLKYADSILKTLATSGSIALSAVLGYLLLGSTLDIFVVIGCVATILAISNYTFDPTL